MPRVSTAATAAYGTYQSNILLRARRAFRHAMLPTKPIPQIQLEPATMDLGVDVDAAVEDEDVAEEADVDGGEGVAEVEVATLRLGALRLTQTTQS